MVHFAKVSVDGGLTGTFDLRLRPRAYRQVIVVRSFVCVVQIQRWWLGRLLQGRSKIEELLEMQD
jgi:hypothetical protein